MLTSPQVVRMRSQLQEFVESFAAELGRSERRHWCGKYLEGLLVEGERKSIEPMAARVNGGDEQAMQQFVNQSPWDYEAADRSGCAASPERNRRGVVRQLVCGGRNGRKETEVGC